MKNQEGTAPAGAKKKIAAAVIAVLAVCLIAAAAAFVWNEMFRVSSVVEIDVNPSIEIEVSKNDKVRDVDALNDDAEIIIGDMEFEGVDIDVAVNALVGSMIRHGYIDEANSSVLVSVRGKDGARSTALKTKVEREVMDILSGYRFDNEVIGQVITDNRALHEKADLYDISLGKAAFIQRIVDTDASKDFGELADAGISELSLIAEANGADSKDSMTDSFDKMGSGADTSVYIGETKAQEIALADAGITADTGAVSDVKYMRTKMDYEDGVLVYEVEFEYGSVEYDYDIRATDGFIMKRDADTDVDIPITFPNNKDEAGSGEYIGETRAKDIALENAGLSESQVTFTKTKLDHDDGRAEYEIEFVSDDTEYEYEIDAVSGQILDYDRDYRDHHDWH